MTLVKVSELEGAALDWAVATVEKLPLRRDPMGIGDKAGTYWVWPEGWPVPEPGYMRIGRSYSPSTNWSQGGPIVERERISIRQWTNVPVVHAYMPFDGAEWSEDGASPLAAAMRCYVASKLGDSIEIPKELV